MPECILDSGESTVSSEHDQYFINVRADGDCTWGAESMDSWITIESGTEGWDTGTANGDGFVKVSVEENSDDTSRSGALEIAGFTFIVTQLTAGDSTCDSAFYTIEPENRSVDWEKSSGRVTVSTDADDCLWKAVSQDTWITITDGTSGWDDGTAAGDGYIEYAVEENLDEAPRTGTIRIAAHDFTIDQEGEDRPQWPCLIETARHK
jgi:hypothetical protein